MSRPRRYGRKHRSGSSVNQTPWDAAQAEVTRKDIKLALWKTYRSKWFKAKYHGKGIIDPEAYARACAINAGERDPKAADPKMKFLRQQRGRPKPKRPITLAKHA